MLKNKRLRKSTDFKLCGEVIPVGTSKRLELSVGRTYDYVDMRIPIIVKRGKKDGPKLFISAAIHGDEINGTEIVRRIINSPELKKLSGTLVCVPIVNVFGFNNKSRYLPDGRDLNRSFPGSIKGALASRVAYLFNKEIVKKCTHGIDLHTATRDRENLPQIRACLSSSETKSLAKAFGAPIVLDAAVRDGSLREAARRQGISMLLYEAGQSLRFDEEAIRIGVSGILSVMRQIGMLPKKGAVKKKSSIPFAKSSHWVRAPEGGLLVLAKKLGDKVKKDEVLGMLSDPFGENGVQVKSPVSGIVIGISNLPLTNQGDALFHIACLTKSIKADKKNLIDTEMAH